ncbi:aminoglycoside phosphotransferase family protein [Leptolyngbya sp. 15MV]|nr:aminoglycoside phosphotransferase family protein [Leptolyngbya sp. 15MV]
MTHLAPALGEHTGGRLSRVQWFRSSHQRGGAATGLAEFRREDGSSQPVVVKVPVGPTEYRWTTGLSGRRGASQAGVASTPGVLAHGMELGGYDLAWVVLERLKGQTLHHGWSRESVEDLLLACARFQAEAESLAAVTPAREGMDWERQIARAREVARQSALPEAQHWNESVKKVQRALPHLLGLWNGRPINAWCHGDLHPGNAMHRDGVDGLSGREPCVLIDLALVHAGHWVEDAVYLECTPAGNGASAGRARFTASRTST